MKRKLSVGGITARIDPRLPPRKIVRVVSQTKFIPAKDAISPLECLKTSLSARGIDFSVKKFDAINDFFVKTGEEDINAYGLDVLDAVRRSDVEQLRTYHKEGRTLKCSNKFGESLLHLACRKSLTSVVDFLINEAEVPVQVIDDMGRSPAHDAFWAAKPNIELISMILKKCPDLLYVSDKRGDIPTSYCRKEHWETWIQFFKDQPSLLLPRKLLSLK